MEKPPSSSKYDYSDIHSPSQEVRWDRMIYFLLFLIVTGMIFIYLYIPRGI